MMAGADAASQVVITGTGLVTGLGLSTEATWAAIRAGRTGLRQPTVIESPIPAGARCGQALDLPPDVDPDLPREARYLRFVIRQALASASPNYPPDRCAVLVGTTLHGIRAGGRFLRSSDTAALRPFLAGAVTAAAINGLGIGAASLTTCSACSSSLGAVALAVTLLQQGHADLVIAGGYDAMSEYAWAGFSALGLISDTSVLPFSRHRCGMMIAEGYAVLALERCDDAGRRQAPILAHVRGWGESADAHHLTQPHPAGEGAARAIRAALARAGITPADVSLIAAHATATPDNDAAEYAAFRAVFGESLGSARVVGFKSYTGHTLGAAGAVELILSACALRDNFIPPSAGVTEADVEFPGLRVAPPGGYAAPLTHAVNTSLGFGGANTCVVLGRGPSALSVSPVSASAAFPRAALRPAHRSAEVWITGFGLILPGIGSAEQLIRSLETVPGRVSPTAFNGTIDEAQLAAAVNLRRARRMSPCVKFMLASTALALRHARLDADAPQLAAASAILASTHGSPSFCSDYYTQIVREGVLAANPVLFAEGVPNAPAAHLSTTFGVRGGCQTIIGSRNAGVDALMLAAARVRSGADATVIVAAAEESHPVLEIAYRLPHGTITPGSAALIVESAALALSRGARCLAVVRGAASISGRQNGTLRMGAGRDAVRLSQATSGADRIESTARAPSLRRFTGDLFSVGPMLSLIATLARSEQGQTTVYSIDAGGTSAAVTIERPTPC